MATHNINGLRNSKSKLLNLVIWGKENRFPIIGISETNIDKKQGAIYNNNDLKFWNYTGYWSNRDNKVKGSGVTILVQNDWNKHVGSVKLVSPYIIELKLFFKGITFIIFMCYLPPNNTNIEKYAKNYIKEHSKPKPRTRYIIMGDFNAIIDTDLDKIGGNTNVPKHNMVIQWLTDNGYSDSYRHCNPLKKEFTWHNNRLPPEDIRTRIDYIWI